MDYFRPGQRCECGGTLWAFTGEARHSIPLQYVGVCEKCGRNTTVHGADPVAGQPWPSPPFGWLRLDGPLPAKGRELTAWLKHWIEWNACPNPRQTAES